MKRKKLIILGFCGIYMVSVLGGCGIGNNTASASEAKISTIELVGDSEFESGIFSARDKETGYDEANSVVITLNDKTIDVNSNAVTVKGSSLVIKDEGTYILRGNLSNGQIRIDAQKTDKVQLVLDGASINSDSSAPIYIRQADKVFLTLAKDSDNTLSTSGEFVAIDDNNINSVIYSRGDLTFNGEGSLVVSTEYGRGIVSKDDLIFTGGSYEVSVSDHGLVGESIGISDGVFRINTSEDGLNSKTDIVIAGGEFEIYAGDDGIHADYNLTISDGIINIVESEEGLEGESIDIAGGIISVVALDDGINAASSDDSTTEEEPYIRISGGIIHVNAQGDGVDANGNVYVTGGETYVSGSTHNADAALDYDGMAEITGGVFIAAGSSGMGQNFGNDSSQGSILVKASTMQSGPVVLKDQAGKELISFTPEKEYSSVVISTADIVKGETYTIAMGGEEQSIEMTDIIYSPAGGMEGRRQGGMRGEKEGFTPKGERPGLPPEGRGGERPELPIEVKVD